MADKFFEIANNLVADEANNYLDKRLRVVDAWVAEREAHGEPADLRSMIDQMLREHHERGPALVALSAALWRLREMRKHGNQ